MFNSVTKMFSGSPSLWGKSSKNIRSSPPRGESSNNSSPRKRGSETLLSPRQRRNSETLLNDAVLASLDSTKFLLEVVEDDPQRFHSPEFSFLKEWCSSVLSNPLRYGLTTSVSVASASRGDDSSTAVDETPQPTRKKARIDPSQEETNFEQDASKSPASVSIYNTRSRGL